MNLAQIGRFLIFSGLTLTIIGGSLILLDKLPGLSTLPGTIRLEQGKTVIIFPIMASIMISLILTVILNIIFRLLGK